MHRIIKSRPNKKEDTKSLRGKETQEEHQTNSAAVKIKNSAIKNSTNQATSGASVDSSITYYDYDSGSNSDESSTSSQNSEVSIPTPKKMKTDSSTHKHEHEKERTRTRTTCAGTAPTSTTLPSSSSPSPPPPSPEKYLPLHLRRYVQHSHSDFFISSSFDPRLIAQLMYEGFLPIATPRYVVPKLHKERCVIYPLHQKQTHLGREQKHIPTLHISKNARKRSNKFLMTMNQSFQKVVEGCHDQHGIAWLYPPIVKAFKAIHEGSVLIDDHETNSFLVRLYSVEVWNAATGELVGGELGYAVGTIYTSLTGFAKESNAGSVQLAALGSFLWQQGFEMWDLGMKLSYKNDLGAQAMEREEFVKRIKELRTKQMGLMKMDETRCCRSIILDGERKR